MGERTAHIGLSENRGTLLGGSLSGDSIFWAIRGVPLFWEMPIQYEDL